MGSMDDFFDLESAGEHIYRLGVLWVVANILWLLSLVVIIALPFALIDILLGTSVIPIFMVMSLIGISIADGIIMLMILFNTIELRRYTDDSRFHTGPLLCVISTVVIIIMVPVFLVWLIYGSKAHLLGLFLLMSMTGILGVVGLIGLILLVIALYELGQDNDISMLSIGAILLIILPIIAGFFIGFGLRELGDRLRICMDYTSIKELKEEFSSVRSPVDIKFLAKSRGLAPLALRMILTNLITNREISGYIKKYTYYPL